MLSDVIVDDAKVMALWREAGLPEWFLGNGGTNVKLLRFAEAFASAERKACGDPVTRLHNLCDALNEQRDTSPYSQQAWDAQDAVYREKCKELNACRAETKRLQRIIDSRPAINAGLPETYIEWSRGIYQCDALQATGGHDA